MIALQRPLPLWCKRMGLAGVLFFLLKGIAWLSLPALLAMQQCTG